MGLMELRFKKNLYGGFFEFELNGRSIRIENKLYFVMNEDDIVLEGTCNVDKIDTQQFVHCIICGRTRHKIIGLIRFDDSNLYHFLTTLETHD